MKIAKSILMFMAFISLLGTLSQAASIQIANTTYVVKKEGVALPNPAAGSGYGLALGYFDASYTPTLDNVATWFSNFRGYRGYWDNTPTIQASIVLKFIAGANNDPDNGAFDNTPVGAAASSAIGIQDGVTQFMEGKALNLVMWGGAYDTTSPSLLSGVAILASSAWAVPNVYDVEVPDALVNSLFLNTSTTALVGTIDNSTTGATARTISLVPEPNTSALLIAGALGLVTLRRFRKS